MLWCVSFMHGLQHCPPKDADAESLLVQIAPKLQVATWAAFSPPFSTCLRLSEFLVSILYEWWRKGTTFLAMFSCNPDLAQINLGH